MFAILKKTIFLFMLILSVSAIPAHGSSKGSFDETLARFDSYARNALREWSVPGMSIVVVKGDRVVYAKGFGTKRFGVDQRVTTDTVFQVGSVTKAFTVALVGQLVDSGSLGWDDRVVDHYSGFRMFDPWVTKEFRIHDLFAQHSGMPNYVGDLQSLLGFDRDHILHSLRYIKPVYSFRDKFSYVNNLFLGGAKVAEVKTGESWETLMQKRIFKPLEMVNSSVDGAGFENSHDKATMHILVGKKPLPIRPGDATFDWPYIYGPAGGLNSSANDMAKWLIAQMNGGAYKNARIFSKETARYMHTPITPVSMGKMSGAYCQGWMEMGLQNTTIIWHNGNALGSKAFIGFSPKLGVGLVILTNLGSQSLPDALAYQFFDMLSGTKNMDWSKELLPDSPQAEEAVATTPILEGFTLASYAGKYDNPVYGEINVAAGTDFLSITLGARQQFTIKAKHISMHLFSGDFVAISPATPEFDFEFVVDKEGRVRSLIMPELNAGQIGTFVRR